MYTIQACFDDLCEEVTGYSVALFCFFVCLFVSGGICLSSGRFLM